MKGKILFVAGAALGYVLGARAGRERYEQIKTGVRKLMDSDPIQSRVTKAQGFAKKKMAHSILALVEAIKTFVTSLNEKSHASGDGAQSDKRDSATESKPESAS